MEGFRTPSFMLAGEHLLLLCKFHDWLDLRNFCQEDCDTTTGRVHAKYSPLPSGGKDYALQQVVGLSLATPSYLSSSSN